MPFFSHFEQVKFNTVLPPLLAVFEVQDQKFTDIACAKTKTWYFLVIFSKSSLILSCHHLLLFFEVQDPNFTDIICAKTKTCYFSVIFSNPSSNLCFHHLLLFLNFTIKILLILHVLRQKHAIFQEFLNDHHL